MKISFRLYDDRADISADISGSSDSWWLSTTFRSLFMRAETCFRNLLFIRVRLHYESEPQMKQHTSDMSRNRGKHLLGVKNINLKLASSELNCTFSGYKSLVEEGPCTEFIAESLLEFQVKQTDQVQIVASRIYDHIRSEQSVDVSAGNQKSDIVDYTIVFERDIDTSDNLSVQKFIVDTIVAGLSFKRLLDVGSETSLSDSGMNNDNNAS